ncbi:hypothetical protein BpHYR1_006679 [Brachionus plicatilis]|uniref:RNA-directed DNA polymerase from mobile element jockey-like n=1 Tax=Brachionus plicatilis TaxID=10195 RepID=A0A3M7QPW4_BRAPC|nr:hypothetical protein BpHYR1_006679 [Brachionus plicatilis]
MEHMKQHKLLTNSHHGFMPHKACVTNLVSPCFYSKKVEFSSLKNLIWENSSEAPEGRGLLEGVLHYSLAVGERLPTFGETYLGCLSVTSRIRAVTEVIRKPRHLPRPMTAPYFHT